MDRKKRTSGGGRRQNRQGGGGGGDHRKLTLTKYSKRCATSVNTKIPKLGKVMGSSSDRSKPDGR